MCVANSSRSQLAEGLARQILTGATIELAGSHPGKLNPYAVAVMKESPGLIFLSTTQNRWMIYLQFFWRSLIT